MPEAAFNEHHENDDSFYRFPMLHSEVHILRKDVDALKNDVADIKRDITILKSDVSELKHSVADFRLEQQNIKSDLRDTKTELKGDIHSLCMCIDGIDKRIDDIHQSQNKWFMLLGFLIAAVPVAIAIVQSFIHK